MLRKKHWIMLLVGVAVLIGAFLGRDRLFRSRVLRNSPDLGTELDRLRDPRFANDPSVVGMALVRLANRQIPEGKEAALARVFHENPTIRAAAVRALVYFPHTDPKISVALETLLADSDPVVRVAILESLSLRAEVTRKTMLERYLARSGSTKEERMLTHFSLYSATRAGPDRDRHLVPILEEAA